MHGWLKDIFVSIVSQILCEHMDDMFKAFDVQNGFNK